MGKIQKYGKWVPRQLNGRQMENRKTICEMLLQRFETFSASNCHGGRKMDLFREPVAEKVMAFTW